MSTLPRPHLSLVAPAIVAAVVLLSACTHKPPQPEWRMNAHDAAERATRAYLAGDSRVAAQEWQRARAQVARTGRPALLARLELMRCAAQVASLEGGACPAFEALRSDAEPPERAYAAYLAGRASAAEVALLPEAQRAAAANPAAIPALVDPLARLVAAGAALQAARATPETLVVATDTASEQGWRRPLLAWLLVRQQRAAQLGEDGSPALVQALQRRIDIVQQGGAPLPPPGRLP